MSNVLLPCPIPSNKDPIWEIPSLYRPCNYLVPLNIVFYNVVLPIEQNRCDAFPHENGPLVLGPFPVDMDITSGILEVDDDISFNGQVFEAGEHVEPGDSCNGKHRWEDGYVFGVVPRGETLSIQIHDNHGGVMNAAGNIRLSIATAP